MLVRFVLGAALISVIGAGCSTDMSTSPTDSNISGALVERSVASSASGFGTAFGHHGDDVMVDFTVRIENVSDGMTLHLSNGETAPAPNSPGVWAVTPIFNPLFKVGFRDLGIGMEAQAEDGDPTVLAESIANNPYVESYGVFNTPVGDDSPGPALPGKAYEFTISARPGDRFTFSSMFGQSNDLFYSTGPVGLPLFEKGGMPVSGDVTRYFILWDAGTEVNQEPGLGSDQAPRQSGPNTGESEDNPVVRVHDEYTYPATNDVIRVTISPVAGVS